MGLRPGSEAAKHLMDNGNQPEWEAAFQSYPSSVRRLSQESGKSSLVELDEWWRKTLPTALMSRGAKPYLLKDELVKVVQWKLWIGAARPSLLANAKKTNAETVKAKSMEAFQHLPRPAPPAPSSSSSPTTAVERVSPEALKKAVSVMTKDIYGVGPATASAILAAWCGGCPFDADEVIDVVNHSGKRAYSPKEYLDVHKALDEKAASLGAPWDAERVRKALWSRAMHSRFKMTGPPVAATPAAAAAAAAAGARSSAGSLSTSSSHSGSSSKKAREGGGASSGGGGGGGRVSGGAAKRQKR